MQKQAVFDGPVDCLPYMNSGETDLPRGTVVSVAGLAGVLIAEVPAGATVPGVVRIDGLAVVNAAAVTASAGAEIWFDADGAAVDTTAGAGAATNVLASGDIYLGLLAKDHADTDQTMEIILNARRAIHGGLTAVADPTGGTTTDAEARAAIGTLIDRLQSAGILASS